MQPWAKYHYRENDFILSANRTVFWENEKMLILSDLHLGKSGHFRKNGIGIPQSVLVEDMQRLVAEIQFFKPTTLLVIGDLFHSSNNKEHAFFQKWRNDLHWLRILLVKGNHDILEDEWYASLHIEVVQHSYRAGNFIFIHDIDQLQENEQAYAFCGHYHPGVELRGLGKQSLKLPCFYFGKQFAVMPAFSKFTGTYNMQPAKGDHVFAIANNSVIDIPYQ